MSRINNLIIGLPQSGKSTFLAALWHTVESGENVESLKITTLSEDIEYVNKLRDSWLKCEQIERTKTGVIQKISLNCITENTNEIKELIFPDVSGEMFELQIQTRKISNDYLEILKSCHGILLFINPNIVKPDLIFEADKILGESKLNIEENNTIAWDHLFTPTQIKLIEVLQFISTINNFRKKIAIVISAWDLIIELCESTHIPLNPENWFSNELPLFDQYLNSNSEINEYKVFGVSAQGGSYENADKKLQEFDKPTDRIIIQDNFSIYNDISIPIKWLMNGNNK